MSTMHDERARHEWRDAAGNTWTTLAPSDFCDECNCTPDCPAHVVERADPRTAAIEQIAQILWPEGDEDHEWSVDTIEYVADVVRPFVKRPVSS